MECYDLCSLFTCTPIGINSHRLLVRGTRTDYTGEEETTSGTLYQSVHTGTSVRRLVVIWLLLTLAAIIASGIGTLRMLMVLKRRRQRREDD